MCQFADYIESKGIGPFRNVNGISSETFFPELFDEEIQAPLNVRFIL